MLICFPTASVMERFFLPTASTYSTCLLRLLLYRNRQIRCLEWTLEQYLELLGGKDQKFYQKKEEKSKCKMYKNKNVMVNNQQTCTQIFLRG